MDPVDLVLFRFKKNVPKGPLAKDRRLYLGTNFWFLVLVLLLILLFSI